MTQEFFHVDFLLSMNPAGDELHKYLLQNHWMDANDRILQLEKPGEGNMNMVLRVITARKRFILKQARPWVQKYPQIPAPAERIIVEGKFYELIHSIPELQAYMPQLLGFDPENFMIAMEDLGTSADFTYLYKREEILAQSDLDQLLEFISRLHTSTFGEQTILRFPDNLALRRLNHEHLIIYPYLIDNGFNLDQVQAGLQELSLLYKSDEALKARIQTLGNRYLSSGNILLHGDYYPGSWLKTGRETRIIDPEFCFFGFAEYDLGVMMAHMKMAQQTDATLKYILDNYAKPSSFNEGLVWQIVGMEILRRIIGLAQLPLELTLEEKIILLKEAAKWVKGV